MIRFTRRFLAAVLLGAPALALGQTQPVPTIGGVHTLVSLDNSTVTSGSPVNVLTAGHAIGGGIVYVTDQGLSSQNAGLAPIFYRVCFNQKGPAGLQSVGDTICRMVGEQIQLVPSNNAVSMNSTYATATVAGYGFAP